jgi:hypothetical protein
METYRVVRRYFRGGRRVIARGLSLAEAQAHCRNPETSSSTCRGTKGKQRTERYGPWFDGFERE